MITRIIGLIVLASFLGACSTIKSPPVNLISVENKYPTILTVPCEDYKKFSTSDIQSVIVTHAENMEKAITCKNKHNELIEIIKERDL